MDRRLDLRVFSVPDLISNAGGWICDQVLAGWILTVQVPPHSQIRPLTILGVEVDEAAGADRVDAAGRLLVWGNNVPGGLLGRRRRVLHKPSAAALAFKTQAHIAAGLPCTAAPSETFWVAGPLDPPAPNCPAAPMLSVVQPQWSDTGVR